MTLKRSASFAVAIFAGITFVGAYWTYYIISQIYTYCYAHSILFQWEPINCSNVFANIFNPTFEVWIITTIAGGIGLALSVRKILERSESTERANSRDETNPEILS